ncbi:polysaccharide biosynthesis/export family protein [Bradyrhizobium sp. SSUT112]|uniref:polysaccharide biosynthesis/export family protein n=1 Tax=Bradyrhizobium sp. SSUT112 TaxID=3040604 RepID=UPI00244B8D06|nr:polysaccharide biosynthesis/export family protein [Bradyrhizobium sp. SSUT112]MDH2355945.1 polysaccharide biosynthesis/export family protein [Bradyrhizobium sp. SSUT112]
MITKRFSDIAMALSLALIFTAPPASVLAGDYKLGVSDRVKIKVQEWPDLAGEYAVNPDGVVSLPLIGNINVAGRNLNDLAREISDRLQQRSEGAQRTFAAVEISQYRPFAILGDVQKPGQYPYRPGLTMLEAISVAGGYYRPELGVLRLGASSDFTSQSAKLNRLIAREARLIAAIDGREDIPLPREFAKKNDPEIAAIMKSEQAALALGTEMKRIEQAGLETIKSLYQNEIGSLGGQVEALAQEKESIRTQLNQLRAMAAKGLALSPTMFALERSFAQVSNEQMSAETAIVKAKENISLAEQRVSDLQQQRRRIATTELEKTRDDIVDARAKIMAATQVLGIVQASVPGDAPDRSSKNAQRASFTILRKEGEAMREIVGDEVTLVAPDDVIKVVPNNLVNLSRAAPPER